MISDEKHNSESQMIVSQNILILTLIALLSFGCEQSINTEQKKPENITADSEKFEAFNKELIIDINGDSVAGYAFIASGESLKETVILLSGYPGNDNNYDIAQELRRNGKNVIHFNHRGAWGSQGIYSYSNCLEDVEKIITYLSQEENSKILRIQKDELTLLGRSYGGGIGLIKGSSMPAVKKIIAISSVNYGEVMKNYNSLDELGGFKRYMQKQIMMNHDIDSFLQELLDNKEEFNILKHKTSLAGKEILIIENSTKNEDWIKQINNAEYINMKSDHNFVDKRSELIKIIVEWLNRK